MQPLVARCAVTSSALLTSQRWLRHSGAQSSCSRAMAVLRAPAAPEERADLPRKFPPPKHASKPAPPKELRDLKLGFIGWGAMAQALSLGVVRAGLTSSDKIMASDIVPDIMEAAEKEGLQTAESATQVVEWADIVIMAVKPQGVEDVLEDIHRKWAQQKMMVSICAGTTIDTYLEGLGRKAKVVRVMPNSSCLIGESASAYASSRAVQKWELDLVHSMFAAVGGATHRVPEHLLNAVTGLSGSGPAYVYMLINAMSDAGVHGGLPRNVALSLATQTVLGAAKMVQESGEHPMVLKEGVTSPAGTTIAGVRTLEKMGFNGIVIEAVEAARARSEQLSKTPDYLYQRSPSLSSIDGVP